MVYCTLTEYDKWIQIAEAVISRDREAWHYELNAINYAAMLTDIPVMEWPKSLAHLRGKPRDEIMPLISDDDVDLVSDLCLRDWLCVALRAERFESRKVSRVREALLARLPEDRRDELLACAKEAIDRREREARLGMHVTLELPQETRRALPRIYAEAAE